MHKFVKSVQLSLCLECCNGCPARKASNSTHDLAVQSFRTVSVTQGREFKLGVIDEPRLKNRANQSAGHAREALPVKHSGSLLAG